MNQDKFIEAATGIACIIVLAVLVWLDPSRGAVIIPIILAAVAGLTAFESGRRKGRR